MIDQDELYGLRCFGVVAFRMPADSDEPNTIVCDEADCLVAYADLMQRAKPMTREDVDVYQNQTEASILCASCMTALDSWTRERDARVG